MEKASKGTVILAVCALVIALVPTAVNARNCQAIGNTVFRDDGTSYSTTGTTTFGSDGSAQPESATCGSTRMVPLHSRLETPVSNLMALHPSASETPFSNQMARIAR